MKRQYKLAGLIVLFTLGSVFPLMAADQSLTDLELLGNHLFKDKKLSLYRNQSCQTCHHTLAGFADPENHLDPYVHVVSVGSDGVSLGGRNAPTSAYAGYSPIRYFDDIREEWFGGMFWDGRATGETLGDPLAEQAQGPPLNPVEMALKNKPAVIKVIKAAAYYDLWIDVFGSISNTDDAYDNFGRAVAAYERSIRVTQFSSKFDKAIDQFTEAEERGMTLFENNCISCHPITASLGAPSALFTTYGYANIGVPANPAVPSPDMGLGADLNDESQDGKFKIPTLRNIAMTAPYTHNGGFPTLYDMVWFINDSGGFLPDVDRNLVDTVGNMGLSAEDIDELIAFLNTLTDGY